MSKLVALKDVRREFPDWPCSYWSTWQLVKKGDLKTVKLGGRHFVTRELIDECISKRTATHFERGRANRPAEASGGGR